MACKEKECSYVWVNKYSDLYYTDPKTKEDCLTDINLYVCKVCGGVRANAD